LKWRQLKPTGDAMLPPLKRFDDLVESSEADTYTAEGPNLREIAAQFSDLTETILQRLG
jgi:hypothetical protein